MSIRFVVQAEDREVEELLAFLQSRFSLSIEDQISVCERGLRWLKVQTESAFDLTGDSEAEFLLTFPVRAEVASRLARTPAEQI